MPECPASLDGISHLEKAPEPGGGTSQLGPGWVDGRRAKSRLRCIRGKRTRERHEPEQSHGKGGHRSCTEPCARWSHHATPIGAWGWSGVLLALEGSRVSYQRGSLISFVPTWLSPSKQQQCQERTEGKPRTGCRKVNSKMPRKQKLGEQQLRPHQQEGGLVP